MMQHPDLLWKTKLDRPISINPILVGSHLFVATASPKEPHSNLVALNLASGEVAWQHRFEYAHISSLLSYFSEKEDKVSGIISTQSSDLLRGQGGVFAFDETGDIIWRWQDKEKSYAALTTQESQILVSVGNNSLGIIDPDKEGEELCKQIKLLVSSSISAPVVHKSVAFIPCHAPNLIAVDMNNYDQWLFQAEGNERNWLDQTPELFGNTVLAVGRRGFIYALDSTSLEVRWQKDLGETRPLSPPVTDGEQVFVGSFNGLYALNYQDGQILWKFPTPRIISARPLILGEVIYVSCEDHRLYALEKANGRVLWHLQMGHRIKTQPILTPFGLFSMDSAGNVVALELPDVPSEVDFYRDKEALIKQLEEQEDYVQVANLWQKWGNLEASAKAYERAYAWQKAAVLWHRLDHEDKRAEALEHYAQALVNENEIDAEDIAQAWETAASVYAELGKRDARQRCNHIAAQHRRLPIISIEIEQKELVVDQRSKLNFVVKNRGFGTARQINIQLKEEYFEGRIEQSYVWFTLTPDEEYARWLEVKARDWGDAVPLRLVVEYKDRRKESISQEQTFYISVANQKDSAQDSQEFARLQFPDGLDPGNFHRKLTEHFNNDDLDDLLLAFSLNPGDFDSKLSAKAREIIMWAAQNKQIEKLIARCKEERPFVNW